MPLRPCVRWLALAPRADAQMPVIDGANLAQNVGPPRRQCMAVIQLKNQLTAAPKHLSDVHEPDEHHGHGHGYGEPGHREPDAGRDRARRVGGWFRRPPSSAASTFYNQNHIYSPTDGSTDSQQLISNGQSIANIEGIASTNLSAIQSRLQDLPDLELDIKAPHLSTK